MPASLYCAIIVFGLHENTSAETPLYAPPLPLPLPLPLSQEGEEIPGEGAVSCCSLPAGTDRPPLSACLQISYRDVICLAAWLNAHLLTRLRLCVCVCVWECVSVWVCVCVCVCVRVCRLLPIPHSWNGVSLFIFCPAITDAQTQRE